MIQQENIKITNCKIDIQGKKNIYISYIRIKEV